MVFLGLQSIAISPIDAIASRIETQEPVPNKTLFDLDHWVVKIVLLTFALFWRDATRHQRFIYYTSLNT
jgi:hypothetical protein